MFYVKISENLTLRHTPGFLGPVKTYTRHDLNTVPISTENIR